MDVNFIGKRLARPKIGGAKFRRIGTEKPVPVF